MDKYKINYIFVGDKDINEILIKVLNTELKNYMQMICKDKKKTELSSCMQFALKEGKHC